ncbi:MAG TPA: hypothetical protein DCG75_07410 [Bacteroidales bacterium]|nr:hypothetical protein [Bacteroidales bacterium]
MKKLLKIFSWFIGILIFVIIALTVVAKLAEDKIADIALRRVSESIEAPVEIDHVSFNLLRKFPLATIELHDVLLGTHIISGSSDSALAGMDTIARIGKIYVSVKSKPLLKGNFEIIKVDIEDATVHYFVDTSGISNIDFLISADETTDGDTLPSKPLNVNITNLSLKNITCYYHDQKIKASAKIKIPEIKVKANIEGEDIMASVFGDISFSDCSFEKTNLNLMNKTDLKFDIDYENDSVSIKKLNVNTDGASLDLLGSVVLGDEINTDIKLKASNLILAELIKYAPREMLNEYGLQKISGSMMLDANVKGIYSDSEMPKVDLTIELRNGNILTADYPEVKNISFKGEVTNGILRNNKSTQAKFSAFHFETEQSKFDLVFSVLDIDHPKYEIKTNMDIHVGEFKNFIPDSLVENITGNIVASLSTKGELPDSIGDDFIDYIMANSTADINLSNFNADLYSSLSIKNFSSKIVYRPNSLKVKNLNIEIPTYNVELKNTSFNAGFKGSINNMAELKLNIKSYHIETKGSVVTGNAKINNLDNPRYEFESKIITNLEEAKVMLPDSLLKTLKGNVVLNVRSKANLNMDSLNYQVMDIVFKNSSYDLKMNNIYAELFDEPLYKIENLSGFIEMNPKKITISKMMGIAGGIEFGIDSTIIENVYNTVIKNQKERLIVNTRMSFGDIDYSMFAPFILTDSTQETKAETEEKTSVPTNFTMLIKGAVKVKSLTYDKVYIEDVSTLFNITDSVYIIDQFKFKAFNGMMSTSVKYMIKPDNKSVIETHHVIDKMDIHKLLADFDNFQAYYEPSIKSENLSGLFSTNLYTRVNMIGDSLIQNDMRVRGSLRLEDGGVYNFEPATSMSKFTGIDELDNIKFKTLESKIFIFKNAIYVPETFISSTALNITAYGMQSLGEDYEYHLKIKLSDILFGKSKKQKRKESKGGEDVVEDERNMREIVAYSLDGKNKNGFDSNDLQSKMKTKIKVQETLLNLRFDPGMFNFDTKVYSDK